MAKYAQFTEKDLNEFLGELYELPYTSLRYFEGMTDVIHVLGLTNEWNEFVAKKDAELTNSPEAFRDCYN